MTNQTKENVSHTFNLVHI